MKKKNQSHKKQLCAIAIIGVCLFILVKIFCLAKEKRRREDDDD